ncbi:MAG: hypothetical protein ACRDGU_00500 [Actinomycetota bacterium]
MFFFGLELLIPLASLGLIVLTVTNVATDRREPDPTGRRPYAIYLFVLTFVALFVAVFSLTATVSSVVRLALPHRGFDEVFPSPVPPGFEPPSEGVTEESPFEDPSYGFEEYGPFDPNVEHTRQAIQSGLIFLAAGLVLLFHARRIRDLEAGGSLAEGPVRRSYQAYLYAVCFVAVLIILVGGALAIFGIVRIAAPGTTGFEPANAERDAGIVQLASSGFLALAAYGLFLFHWRRASVLRAGPLEPEPPPPS